MANILDQLFKAQLENSATDLTPASTGLIYFNTVTKLAKIYDGTLWNTLGGSAGGSGEINSITDSSDANAIWTASAAGVTVATSTTAAELPLSPIITTGIKITLVSGTDYVRYRWTMGPGLKNRKLKIEWHQLVSSFATGDAKLEIYQNAASNYGGAYTKFALSTDSSSTSSIPNSTGKYSSSFDSDSSDYYELRIVRTAGTGYIVLQNVIVGPGIQPQGAVVGNSTSITLTPSAGWGTTTSQVSNYERVGSWMHLRCKFVAGTGAASTASIALPSGFTINYSALTTATNACQLGSFYELIANASAAAFIAGSATAGAIFADGSDTSTLFFAYRAKSNGFEKVNESTLVNASNSTIVFDCWIPISEWSGSGTVNLAQNDIEYASNSSSTDASDTTSFVYGPAGSVGILGVTAMTTARKKRIRFLTPVQPSDIVTLEFDLGGNGRWVPSTQAILSNFDNIQSFMTQNAGVYGVGLIQVNTTDFDIAFGQYSTSNGATFGAAGKAWNSVDWASSRWRAKKAAAGAAVGFGAISEFSNGLMPYSHANLDNASATRLGLKSYSHGTSYNGSIAPTVTLSGGGGALSTVDLADFLPYQRQDLSWHCKFTVKISVTSVSRTTANISVNGLTFFAAGGNGQAVAGWDDSGSSAKYAFAKSNSSAFEIAHSASNSTAYYVTGDVKLASKPTWAY